MGWKDHPDIDPREMERIRDEALDFAGIGFYRYIFDGTIVFMDIGAVRLLDLEKKFPDPADVTGHNVEELLIYEGPKGLLRSQIRKHGRIRDFPYPFKTLTGKRRCALHDSFLTHDPVSGEELIQVIVKDITPLKNTEDQLESEREKLTVTLRSIGDGVISTDTEGTIVLINKEAELLTGWTEKEAVGKPLANVFRVINERTREPIPSPVDEVLKEGHVVGLANHTVLIAKDGREIAITDSGAPIFDRESRIIGVVLVFRNAESERQADEARERAEKLESLGILAGGIAHDFNNYLTAILGNISLSKNQLTQEKRTDDVVDMLDDAEKSSVMARGLTEQLLTFARGGTPMKRALELPDLLARCVEFALSGSSVKPELGIAPDLWPVEADIGQLSQVIDNLTINAKQAMPEGGTFRVLADNVILEDGAVAPLHGGRYVRIRFSDQGIGIHPNHLGKIFDPYFTTKQQGSGLGLATAYSIIDKHGGVVTVESNLGEGTSFCIYLPAGDGEGVPATAVETERAARGARILLMDDKDFVLRAGTRVLRSLGYAVECAKDGGQAVEIYKKALEAGAAFDAVILDLTVPGGMGGVETLRELHGLDPEVRAIASSGYSTDAVMSDYDSYGFSAVIIKPYTIESAARAIADVLQ